jgi:hypothetical protein
VQRPSELRGPIASQPPNATQNLGPFDGWHPNLLFGKVADN